MSARWSSTALMMPLQIIKCLRLGIFFYNILSWREKMIHEDLKVILKETERNQKKAFTFMKYLLRAYIFLRISLFHGWYYYLETCLYYNVSIKWEKTTLFTHIRSKESVYNKSKVPIAHFRLILHILLPQANQPI